MGILWFFMVTVNLCTYLQKGVKNVLARWMTHVQSPFCKSVLISMGKSYNANWFSNFRFVFSSIIFPFSTCIDFALFIVFLRQCDAKIWQPNITPKKGMCSILRIIFISYKNTLKRHTIQVKMRKWGTLLICLQLKSVISFFFMLYLKAFVISSVFSIKWKINNAFLAVCIDGNSSVIFPCWQPPVNSKVFGQGSANIFQNN